MIEKKSKLEASITSITSNNVVNSLETLKLKIEEVREAQRKFATYTQEQVDKIFLAAATEATKNRIPLAKMAVEEKIWEF